MGRNWHEWHASNRWYFTRETLHLLTLSAGFEHIALTPERRTYSLKDLSERLEVVAELPISFRVVKRLRHVIPRALFIRKFPLPSGTMVMSAVAVPKRPECVVSIIVPVFNERATLRTVLDTLLSKSLKGVRKEIIVVESNSTDGSRELVQHYAQHPDVRILLQDAPRGKGHAVREGLSVATGDILMIQDADLEYDIDDYDGLLAPLIAWQAMFVLGSRHQGGWKMRKFNDAPLTAAIFNLGHGFYRTIINAFLNTSMTDPFTMYKLFRRDALHGLDLVCDRFDFDIELVMKLVRRGYVPIELPVNYAARSFAEGKKVSFTRDGLVWLWAIFKLRFSSLYRGHP
jgi:glycosyltransferase involved in cell wall biosynthesis